MTSRPDDAAEQPAAGAREPIDGAPTPAGADARGEASGASDAAAEVRDASPASDAATADVSAATDADEPDAPPTDPGASPDADADEPAPIRERPVTVERDDVQVRARLVPRYGRFMVLGALLGAVGGWLFSRLGSSGPWLGAGPVIDTSAVVPFLVVVGIVVGIVLGAVVAIVLDRLVGRRRRIVTAERTRHHRDDAED